MVPCVITNGTFLLQMLCMLGKVWESPSPATCPFMDFSVPSKGLPLPKIPAPLCLIIRKTSLPFNLHFPFLDFFHPLIPALGQEGVVAEFPKPREYVAVSALLYFSRGYERIMTSPLAKKLICNWPPVKAVAPISQWSEVHPSHPHNV